MPKTPEKRAALKDIGVETALVKKDKLPLKQPALPRPSPAGHTVRGRIRLPSLARARAYRDVQAFYFREDVARTLPNKRYATKAGAGRLMLMTIEEAFILFKKHHPEAPVKFTKFYLLKPKTIRLIAKGTPETCACMYCLNVRLKNEVLNKVLSANLESFRMAAETKMLDLLLCQKLDNQRWHHHLCLSGHGQFCGDPQKVIHDKFQLYMDQPTSWQHWERISVDGRTRLDLPWKAGKLRDLLKEFVEKDLKQPAQGSTFVRHMHTFFWQYNQYADLKASLHANEAIMVMDFAENRKASYTVEVVPPNEAVEGPDELLVSFLISQGSYFLYPEKEEVCLVGKEEVLQLVQVAAASCGFITCDDLLKCGLQIGLYNNHGLKFGTQNTVEKMCPLPSLKP